jgi:hypothetical protein
MVTADRQRQTALITLQQHWGGLYEISVRDGKWFGVLAAHPMIVLEADTSGDLRTQLENDWAARKPPATTRWAGNASC